MSQDELHHRTSDLFSFSSLKNINVNPVKIYMKFPVKTHHELLIENHEKLNLLKKGKSWNFDGIFWDHETPLETPLFQNFIQKNMCKVLEGFNCNYVLSETWNKSMKSMEFYSFLLMNLEFFRKILQNFQGDQITYLIKSSFFITQDKTLVKDLFEDLEEMQRKKEDDPKLPQLPSNKYFIDVNELIKIVTYKLSNLELEKLGLFVSKNDSYVPFQIGFKLELFLYNNNEKICWKGGILLIDQCVKSMSYDLISPLLSHFQEPNSDSHFENSLISQILLEEKDLENGFLNVYLKYNELNVEKLDKICENFDDLRNSGSNRVAKPNCCNNIPEYISMILDLQKRGYIRDYEIYNQNMNLFLKEKELDECKLKIAQLESSLYYQNFHDEKMQNISVVEPIFDEIENDQQELCPERSQTVVNEENIPNFFRSLTNYVGSSFNQIILNQQFRSANVIPDFGNITDIPKVEKEMNYQENNAYEQLLEINYYEELTMLRTKFQKVNKELVKKSFENGKLRQLIEKLKEQHTIFNGLSEFNDIKPDILEKEEPFLESLKKKDEEIKGLRKLLWEKDKAKELYFSEIMKYYIGDVEKIKEILILKLKEITEEQEKEKKVMIALEIEKLNEIVFNQFYCKAKTNEELLRELNELYVYYYKMCKYGKKTEKKETFI